MKKIGYGIAGIALLVGILSITSHPDKNLSTSLATTQSISPINNSSKPKTSMPLSSAAPASSPQLPQVAAAESSVTTTPQEYVSFTSVTSPVSPGSNATLSVHTLGGSACSIIVHYKSGPSTAAGLYNHKADNDGYINWSWMVGTRTTRGTWPIAVSCSNSLGSATSNTSFDVQ